MSSFRSPVFIVIESVVQIVEQLGRARSKVEIDMRKRQISPTPASEPPSSSTWLDVEHKASVEVTSEENGYPIESALLGVEGGWHAADTGTQTIRLIFDEPQRLRRIWLIFEDSENTRTQEFVLRWSLIMEIVFEKSSASSGISVRPIQYGRQKTTLSNSLA